MDEQEELRQAAQILMENRWVTRKDMPEEYLLIRRLERPLRHFFRDRCGWPLLVTAQFYKLEKIPAQAQSFMGLAPMQSREDYVLLACVLAFLEEYETGGQFLLGELAEALLSYYPEDAFTSKLNWEDYSWRKALIRVLKFLAEEKIINIVDDESEGFVSAGLKDGVMGGEALYEVTSLSRYFLRSFPKELQYYSSLQELAEADFFTENTEEAQAARQRRQRLYRSLLLTPVFYKGEDPLDFLYLRNRRERFINDLSDYLGLHYELYQNAALAVSHEQNTWFRDVFPAKFRGLHDIMLHLSHYLRQLPKETLAHPFSQEEWLEHLAALAEATRSGWTKEYREMKQERLSRELLAEMQAWGMARVGADGSVTLLSAAFRHEGAYPKKYGKKEAEEDK
ncbi:MAG: TIGR02678 family protein [Selenomonas sp.]|nr:TIGR02678 family protein [Selenomonas sp.]